MALIVLDGSQGEGGGQVLRTALALSIITGRPFRIENIRAKREKPGLLRQHLTAVQAAAQVGEASVDGAELGARSLAFVPTGVRAGDYRFSIGTAGSTTLVLQTVLVPLLLADAPSTLVIEGGTHNPSAPPFEFLERAFLPLLRRMGAEIELTLVRPGFYPAGGGAIQVRIAPARSLRPLIVEERGAIAERRVRAVVANLPYEIAQREVRAAAGELEWGEETQEAHTITGSAGPGNTVSITVASEHVTEVFTAFGARGVRAEQVAHDAAKQAKRYINSDAAVGEHLADQLLLPMAAGGGGSFTTTPLSSHAITNLDVIRRFTDVRAEVEDVRRGMQRVRIGSAN
ncbi:MAG TPA: RNA 3'-terminal phosphate cyclase [Thermoanaerobaculia bacterium]|nr:RNA 3'-terminal phosphate cyclase [Thermoanaerobaculia bacterium]